MCAGFHIGFIRQFGHHTNKSGLDKENNCADQKQQRHANTVGHPQLHYKKPVVVWNIEVSGAPPATPARRFPLKSLSACRQVPLIGSRTRRLPAALGPCRRTADVRINVSFSNRIKHDKLYIRCAYRIFREQVQERMSSGRQTHLKPLQSGRQNGTTRLFLSKVRPGRCCEGRKFF